MFLTIYTDHFPHKWSVTLMCTDNILCEKERNFFMWFGWMSVFKVSSKLHYNQPLDRHCTYKVTLRRVRATIVAVEKHYIIWERVCSLGYLAWNEHAPYCYLLPNQLYNNFAHYLINGKIFEEKKVIEHESCIKIFSTALSFLILRRNEQEMIKNVY